MDRKHIAGGVNYMEAIQSTLGYDAFISALPSTERPSFSNNVLRLQESALSNAELSEFLSDFATTTAELFAASSVGIWFRPPSTSTPLPDQPKVSVGWKNLGLDKDSEISHRNLVHYAMQQSDSLAVRPFSSPEQFAGVSNPTDSFILLGTVNVDHDNIAAIEIVLGPKPLRRPHQELIESYLVWLRWLSQLLQNGIQQCFANASPPYVQALDTVHRATQQAAAMQEQIRVQLELSLRNLAGHNFGTLRENQTVTKQIHELLDSKALRVRCPECGAAAILRCQKAGNSKTGAFMYDHYLDSGRTFHGGQTTFPEVTLVGKPARRQKR